GYAGGASWKGGFFADTIDIGGSRAIATFAVMYYQTPDNVVADGSWTQGILGLAYDALARAPVPPKTVFSSFVSNNIFTQDVFAFRGCPATSKSKSYLDFGATDDSLTCISTNQPLGWVQVTSKTYYVVNVLKVGVDGGEVGLPSDWQSDYDRGSIVDSCTTLLILPKGVFDAFVAAIKKSGVLAKAGMSAAFQNAFLYQYTGMSSRYFNLDFASLPKISFVLQKADGAGTVTLTMSGFNYIQGDGQGDASTSIIFGATLFQAYYIVFDRAGGRIGFGPGCDCARFRKMFICGPPAHKFLNSNDASTVAQVSVSGSGGVPKNQASAIDDSLKKSYSLPARLGQLSIAIYVTLCFV
ncbi:Beta-secretase 2, partial [Chytriomyces hyalinus]